ncbi:MAG: hypothetical protein Rubg2KO_22440 [Rubricoccaceae bacterium]
MRHTLVLGIGLLLLAGLGVPLESASQVPVELAARASYQTVAHVELPCAITIQAENRSTKAIEVDVNESRVKTKSGLWQTLEAAGGEGACTRSALGFEGRSGAAESVCTLARACDQERRYKFKMTYDGNIVWAYYPSANGWTTDTVLDLGNVGRHFQGF